VKNPIYATAIGLVIYAVKNRYELEGMLAEGEATLFEKIWERMKMWFS
jgi:hypothetical protein